MSVESEGIVFYKSFNLIFIWERGKRKIRGCTVVFSVWITKIIVRIFLFLILPELIVFIRLKKQLGTAREI